MKATAEPLRFTDNVYADKGTPPLDKGSLNENVIDLVFDVTVPDSKGGHGFVAAFVTVFDGSIKRIRVLSLIYKLSYPEFGMTIIKKAN